MNYLLAFGVGCLAGLCSGLFGIGGGIIIVPLLIFCLGYSQGAATGTSLVALLFPVGFLGVLEYYSAGKITMANIRYGMVIALGIFVATFFGAKFAISLPDQLLRRMFSIFLVLVAARLWF